MSGTRSKRITLVASALALLLTGGAATPRASAGEARATIPPSADAAPRPGRLEGRVLAGAGGQAIPGATVTLLSAQGTVGTTLAAEDGAFAFADVAPGSYRVRIEADGFLAV